MSEITRDASTRRALLRAGSAAGLGIVAVVVGMRAAVAQEKLAKEQAQYQTEPKDGAKCSGCVNFQAPNACAIVAGEISPNGWCVAYAPKDG